jgi:hypothetical protein
VNGHRNVNGVSGEKEKGRRNRKNKKGRREIEESWDIPPPSFVDPVASTSFNMLPGGSACVTVSLHLAGAAQYVIEHAMDINIGS